MGKIAALVMGSLTALILVGTAGNVPAAMTTSAASTTANGCTLTAKLALEAPPISWVATYGAVHCNSPSNVAKAAIITQVEVLDNTTWVPVGAATLSAEQTLTKSPHTAWGYAQESCTQASGEFTYRPVALAYLVTSQGAILATLRATGSKATLPCEPDVGAPS